MTNLNNNELSARTNLHNFCNTVKAGLHSAVVSPRKRHALLCLLYTSKRPVKIGRCRLLLKASSPRAERKARFVGLLY